MMAVFVALALRTAQENADRVLDDRLVTTAVAARNLGLIVQLSLNDLASEASRMVFDPQQGVTEADTDRMRAALEQMAVFDYRVSLVDRFGTIRWTEPYDPSLIGASLAGRPFLQEALADPRPRVSNMLTSLSGKPIVALVVPLVDRSGHFSGLLSGDIDLSGGAAADFLPPMDIGTTGYVQVVDTNGNILMSSSPLGDNYSGYDSLGHLRSLVARGHPTTGRCFRCHEQAGSQAREPETMAFYPVLAAPWGIIVRQSESEAMAGVWRLQQEFLWAGLGVLIAALGLVGFSIRRVFGPLQALTAAAGRIAQGDFDVDIPRLRSNEIGDLAQSFEQMRVKVRALLEEERLWRESLEIQVQEATKDLASLCEVSQAVNKLSLNLKNLLNDVLGKVMDAMETADAATLFLHERGKGLIPVSCIGYEMESISRVKLKPGEGMTGSAFLRKEPILCNSIELLSEARKTLSKKNRLHLDRAAASLPPAKSGLALPLAYAGEIEGVLLVVSHHEEDAFSPTHLNLAESVADQVAVGLSNARLYEELQQREASRSDLLRKLISAQEEERRRVARELHDEAGQALTAVMISAARAEQGLPPEMQDARNRLAEAQSRASQALNDVRRLVFDLRPQALDDLGLAPALRWFMKTRVQAASLESRLEISGIDGRLPGQVEVTVFRVVQEAVTNVLRHSEATKVIIRISRRGPVLSGIIEDNGKGFASKQVLAAQAPLEGWGLRGMEERVHLLGGAFSVKSEPGKATQIEFTIPLGTLEAVSESSDEEPG